MSTTDTRAAFEVQQENDYSPVYLGKNNCGDYADGEVQGRWLAWKAALDWQAATEAAKATGTAGEQDGWKTVPRKMTDEQAKETAYNINRKYKVVGPLSDFLVRQIWEFGIYASPNPPAEAARQPAPVVAVKTWEQRMDEAGEGDCIGWDAAAKYVEAEIAELRAALAATAAPVLSDEQINDLWNALPGIEIHNKASAQGMSTDYALRIAFAKAIIAATRSQP